MKNKSNFEPGRAFHAEVTCHDRLWPKLDDDIKAGWIKGEKNIISKFLDQVNAIAESNMLKTGRLEGSHYAAIQQLLKRYQSGE